MPILGNNAPWSRRTVSLRSRRQRERPKSTGDFKENHHFIWHLSPSCVAKRSREHFKSKQGVHLMPTLERNAPWSRRTVSLRQRERPKSTGDSEDQFIWHRGPSCVAKRSREHLKSKQGAHLTPCLSAMFLGAGVQLAFVLIDSAKDRNRRAILRKITTLFSTSVPPALPNDHEYTLTLTLTRAGVQFAFVLVDSEKDRDRPAILRKITTLFDTSVPPALPNDHKKTSRRAGCSPCAQT